jgi:hypothetical protein
MDINSFLGFDRGANKEAADYARQNDGQISINPLQRFFGADESDVQNILNRENQKSLNSTYGAALALAGRGGADWGESESSIQGRIASGQRKMKASEEAKQRGYRKDDAATALTQATTLKGMDLQAGRDQFAAQLDATRLDNQASRDQQSAQYAHTSQQNRLDRGLERELASNSQEMNLAIAQMNSDLADKRMDYDRETARMDRRSAAIAQLMSGLGSLGGAFSL